MRSGWNRRLGGAIGHAGQQEGHQRHLLGLAPRGKQALEVLACTGGRSWAAPACPPAAPAPAALAARVMATRLSSVICQRQAAQRVVAAEFDHHHRRPVLLQQGRQPRAAARGGVAADAGIDHLRQAASRARRCSSRATQPVPRGRPYSADRLSPTITSTCAPARRPGCLTAPSPPPAGTRQSRLQSRSHRPRCRRFGSSLECIPTCPSSPFKPLQAGGRRHRHADHSA
jgi:hypothetical protein